MDLAELLSGRRVCICAGSGGVGKTSASAAIGLGMAARGARVAVVTIDPARRLATALGLAELSNEPRRVDPALLGDAGVEGTGELWAMMLDSKRTFDELIERLAPSPEARDEVLGNRIYREISNAVAGSQEFTAVAKLAELHFEGGFDLVVLDTPPSRNALDFLDAPDRIMSFFHGRAVSLFLRPTGRASRLVGRGTGMVFSVLKRATGVDLLDELSVFFRALSGLIDGFTRRAEQVRDLLSDPATTFVLVTAPEPEPVEEVIFFWRKLRDAGMPFGALVVNRVRAELSAAVDAADVASALEDELGGPLAARVAENFGDLRMLAQRDARAIEHVESALGIHGEAVVVPLLDDDVHDLGGLARLAGWLLPREEATAADRAA